MSQLFLTWDQTAYPIIWGVNGYTWEDVSVFLGVVPDYAGGGGGGGGGGFLAVPRAAPLRPIVHRTEQEQETFVKVVLRINGKEYRGSRLKGKRGKSVTAGEVKRALESVAGPRVTVRIV